MESASSKALILQMFTSFDLKHFTSGSASMTKKALPLRISSLFMALHFFAFRSWLALGNPSQTSLSLINPHRVLHQAIIAVIARVKRMMIGSRKQKKKRNTSGSWFTRTQSWLFGRRPRFSSFIISPSSQCNPQCLQIRIGPEFQAELPLCEPESLAYIPLFSCGETLLWRPIAFDTCSLRRTDLLIYFELNLDTDLTVQNFIRERVLGRERPDVAHELALVLLAKHAFSDTDALKEFQGLAQPLERFLSWSAEEIAQFEAGLATVGKKFYLVRDFVVRGDEKRAILIINPCVADPRLRADC